MVYLGPIIRLTPSRQTRPTGYEPDRDLLIDKNLPQRLPPTVERRSQRDRRQRNEKPLVEMRSGRDRRRKKRIDIEV